MAELSLDDVAVFVRVVERGGFASAARELGVPTSNVSRAIGRLESRAGVRLLHRTTRNVRPTSDGHDLYTSVAPAVTTLRGAAQALEPATRRPKGRLRITAPNDLAAAFLADVMVAFADRYPLVHLDVCLTNAHMNLVEHGFDVAVRATAHLDDSSLVVRKLGDLELGLYASPRYIQKHGAPARWDELPRHQCVVFRAKELAKTWALRGADGDWNVPVEGRIGGDDFAFVRAIVRAGGGIGILPRINCAADEASGHLVRVLPELHARGASLYILYPSAKNVPARVTAFRDFIVAAFGPWGARPREGI
jgi:DNA-binding transcriptional LysR family regulator